MFGKTIKKTVLALAVSALGAASAAKAGPLPDPKPTKEEGAMQVSVVVLTGVAVVAGGLLIWAVIRRRKRSEH